MSRFCDPAGEEMIRPWSDLPEGLLEEITSRLCSADRIRFGAVCRNFFKYHNSLLSNPEHGHWAIDRLPWLLRLCEDRSELFDPIHQHLYAVHRLRLSPRIDWTGMTVLASKNGWLFCSQERKDKKSTRVSFHSVSLFTNQLIKLPNLHFTHHSGSKFVRSADFSSDPSSPDCVYFVVHQNIRRGGLRVSTLQHGDGMWRDESSLVSAGLVHDVAYHDGCLYLVTGNGNLRSYNVVSRIWSNDTRLSAPVSRNYIRRYHVVVSEGKFLVVCLDIATPENSGDEMDCCSVHEFDSFSKTWVQRTSLGDHALFLGTSSFSVSANGTRARGIEIANKVYYYHPSEWNEPRYYSLEEDQCHKSTSSCWFGNVDAGMWIEPPQLPTPKI